MMPRSTAWWPRADASPPARPLSSASCATKTRTLRILSLRDLLQLVDARVPLLVEIKSSRRMPKRFLAAVAAAATDYRGPIALMSFDRAVVLELAKLAPAIPRGIVLGSHQLAANWWAGPSVAGQNAAVSALLKRAPPGISFFAVDVRMLEAAKAWLAQHAPDHLLFTWTVRTAKERAAAARWADAPIFESGLAARRGSHVLMGVPAPATAVVPRASACDPWPRTHIWAPQTPMRTSPAIY